MAVESCSARFLRRVTETALRLRQPAHRYAGSVHTAVVVSSILVGAYDITIGSVYTRESWRFHYGMSGLITSGGLLAFITAFTDAAVLFGILRKKDEILQSVVCAALSGYMLCAPIPLAVIVGLTYNMKFLFQLWEVPRLVGYPLHLCLLYCLLVEVREGATPPPAPDAGWLHNNLAHQAAHAAPLKGDELVLKVHGSPTKAPTLAPSSCTTAAPVHQTYAPPSGPLSSSDA